MYKYATGWLGWPDDVAMKTPIPRLLLALDGKADFLRVQSGAPDRGQGMAEPRSGADVAKSFRALMMQAGARAV